MNKELTKLTKQNLKKVNLVDKKILKLFLSSIATCFTNLNKNDLSSQYARVLELIDESIKLSKNKRKNNGKRNGKRG